MIILNIVLSAIIIIQAIIYCVERRDMLNRLMSKDLSEYKQGKDKKPPMAVPSAHDRVLKKWRNKVGDE